MPHELTKDEAELAHIRYHMPEHQKPYWDYWIQHLLDNPQEIYKPKYDMLEDMITPEDAKNLLALIARVNITGQEATAVVLLQQKLSQIANEVSHAKDEETVEVEEE